MKLGHYNHYNFLQSIFNLTILFVLVLFIGAYVIDTMSFNIIFSRFYIWCLGIIIIVLIALKMAFKNPMKAIDLKEHYLLFKYYFPLPSKKVFYDEARQIIIRKKYKLLELDNEILNITLISDREIEALLSKVPNIKIRRRDY